MRRTIRTLATGLLTYVPGLRQRAGRGTGGTTTARYCFDVWMRHFIAAHSSGHTVENETIAEMGPGDSLGTGLAALLSGADRYFALDVVRHADAQRNLAIFDELVDLFRSKASLTDGTLFPTHLLDAERLARMLQPSRLATIRASLRQLQDPAAPVADDLPVQYLVPWHETSVCRPGSVGLIFSQAALCYPPNLPEVYAAMHRWLKPGGLMSHVIDFRSLSTADAWNGHWTYPDPLWRLMCGKRPYVPNREPYSTHFGLIEDLGMQLVYCRPRHERSAIARRQLAPRFRHLSDADLVTSGCFIQAAKPA